MNYDRNSSNIKKSCDLAEEVRRSNHARAKMMGYEKYDMFIINPLFGTGLRYGNANQVNNGQICFPDKLFSSYRRSTIIYSLLPV